MTGYCAVRVVVGGLNKLSCEQRASCIGANWNSYLAIWCHAIAHSKIEEKKREGGGEGEGGSHEEQGNM